MSNDNQAPLAVIDNAENFLDLDDLDLAGIDVEHWEPAGGTTPACITYTITVNICPTLTTWGETGGDY